MSHNDQIIIHYGTFAIIDRTEGEIIFGPFCKTGFSAQENPASLALGIYLDGMPLNDHK